MTPTRKIYQLLVTQQKSVNIKINLYEESKQSRTRARLHRDKERKQHQLLQALKKNGPHPLSRKHGLYPKRSCNECRADRGMLFCRCLKDAYASLSSTFSHIKGVRAKMTYTYEYQQRQQQQQGCCCIVFK
ncbi:hypothetical protein CBL_00567 [Carabus blaptoides fortunei]